MKELECKSTAGPTSGWNFKLTMCLCSSADLLNFHCCCCCCCCCACCDLFAIESSKSGAKPCVVQHFRLPNVLLATTACTLSSSHRHRIVKIGPNPRCFVHFDSQMCFAPQRRAFFRHRNVQKSSDPEVFCTCLL